jgi:uncharacterized protein YuzE
MKIKFFPETDSMMISLSDKPSKETVIINDNVNIDFDENNNPTMIDIHSNASKFNLTDLEIDLPKLKQKFG